MCFRVYAFFFQTTVEFTIAPQQTFTTNPEKGYTDSEDEGALTDGDNQQSVSLGKLTPRLSSSAAPQHAFHIGQLAWFCCSCAFFQHLV